MTLRSYWTALGSLVVAGFLVSCSAPNKAEPPADAATKHEAKAVVFVEPAPEDVMPLEGTISDGDGYGDGDDGDGSDSSGFPAAADGGDVPPDPEPIVHKKKKRPKSGGCKQKGYDRYDGKCLPSEKAKYLKEMRDEKHLKELQQAESAADKAMAQQKVLEDQAQQVEQYEEDLDQILQDLAEKKKKGEGPFDKGDPFDG